MIPTHDPGQWPKPKFLIVTYAVFVIGALVTVAAIFGPKGKKAAASYISKPDSGMVVAAKDTPIDFYGIPWEIDTTVHDGPCYFRKDGKSYYADRGDTILVTPPSNDGETTEQLRKRWQRDVLGDPISASRDTTRHGLPYGVIPGLSFIEPWRSVPRGTDFTLRRKDGYLAGYHKDGQWRIFNLPEATRLFCAFEGSAGAKLMPRKRLESLVQDFFKLFPTGDDIYGYSDQPTALGYGLSIHSPRGPHESCKLLAVELYDKASTFKYFEVIIGGENIAYKKPDSPWTIYDTARMVHLLNGSRRLYPDYKLDSIVLFLQLIFTGCGYTRKAYFPSLYFKP